MLGLNAMLETHEVQAILASNPTPVIVLLRAHHLFLSTRRIGERYLRFIPYWGMERDHGGLGT